MGVVGQCPTQSSLLLHVRISFPASVRDGLPDEVEAMGTGKEICNGSLYRGNRDTLVFGQFVRSKVHTVNYDPVRFFPAETSTFGNGEMNLCRVDVGESKN
jgi:hypothetical protein